MKLNYFESSAGKKRPSCSSASSLQSSSSKQPYHNLNHHLSLETPLKDQLEPFDEHLLNSCSSKGPAPGQANHGCHGHHGGVGDAAFSLYCQQNLSPINNFHFNGRNSFLCSPDTGKQSQPHHHHHHNQNHHNGKHFDGSKTSKSMFSPTFSNQPGPRCAHPHPHTHTSHLEGLQTPTDPTGRHIKEVNSYDVGEHLKHHHQLPHEEDHHHHHLHHHHNNEAAGPMDEHPLNEFGKPKGMKAMPIMSSMNNSKCYTVTSPVFKIKFSGNKEHVQEISYEGYSSIAVQPLNETDEKTDKQLLTDAEHSYKRVIKFNEDEDSMQGSPTNIPPGSYAFGRYPSSKVHMTRRQMNYPPYYNNSNPNGVVFPNETTDNPVADPSAAFPVYEESQMLMNHPKSAKQAIHGEGFDSQKSMSFNPNSSTAGKNATTVKKSEMLEEKQSSTKSSAAQQKRKLFESPSGNDRDDLQTPSTKKKKVGASASNSLFTFGKSTSSTAKREGNKNSKEITEFKTPGMSQAKKKKKNLKIVDEEEEDLQKRQEAEDRKEVDEIFLSQDEDEEEQLSLASKALDSAAMPPNNNPLCTIPPEDKKICCNCKRSKCLKLYCECFAASRVCEGCTCQGCFNKVEFESMRQEARNAILERNSSAFDSKIEQQSKLKYVEVRGTNEKEQKVHSKGCNCKMSGCQKKYCECFQLGVKCTKLCKCENCKNTGSDSNHGHPTEEHESRQTSSAAKAHKHLHDYSMYNSQYYYDNYYQYYYAHPSQSIAAYTYPNASSSAYPYYYNYQAENNDADIFMDDDEDENSQQSEIKQKPQQLQQQKPEQKQSQEQSKETNPNKEVLPQSKSEDFVGVLESKDTPAKSEQQQKNGQPEVPPVQAISESASKQKVTTPLKEEPVIQNHLFDDSSPNSPKPRHKKRVGIQLENELAKEKKLKVQQLSTLPLDASSPTKSIVAMKQHSRTPSPNFDSIKIIDDDIAGINQKERISKRIKERFSNDGKSNLIQSSEKDKDPLSVKQQQVSKIIKSKNPIIELSPLKPMLRQTRKQAKIFDSSNEVKENQSIHLKQLGNNNHVNSSSNLNSNNNSNINNNNNNSNQSRPQRLTQKKIKA